MKQQKKVKKVNLFLDSGAFSAWYHGSSVDLQSYMNFIREHLSIVDNYVSLDTIPGDKGRMDRSQREIEKSAAASYRNQQIMKDAGLSPIPVFHQGERFEWLEKYLKDGEGYIGISPYLRSSNHDIIKWMDNCFSIVTDSLGHPLVKTHGFGATGHQTITRYPWHSVDSTTWAVGAGYGLVKIPQRGRDGKPDMLRTPKQVYVGNDVRSGGAAKLSFDGLTSSEQSWVAEFAALFGLAVTDLRTDHEGRKALNIGFIKLLEARGATAVFKYRRAKFGGHVPSAQRPEAFPLKILFAAKIGLHYQNATMTRCGADNRLLSYYELKDETPEDFHEYVMKGFLGEDKLDCRAHPRRNWVTRSYNDFRRRSHFARYKDQKDEQKTTA